MNELDVSVRSLKGVGEKRGNCYEKLGIRTVRDLLYHIPRDYVDYSEPKPVLEAPLNENCVIKARVMQKLREQRIRKGLSVYKVIMNDEENDFTVVFYNNHFAYDALKTGEEYYLYGKVTGGYTRREMNSPHVLPGNTESLVRPVYPLTEGLTGAMIETNMREALKSAAANLYDFVPKEITLENKLCSLGYALENIHYPADSHALELARKRLAFDELLVLQLGMYLLKGRNRELSGCTMSEKDLSPLFDSLPFEPTGAQKKAIAEITADMQGKIPMNRLLQGDVGSGKTAVAAAACYFAYLNGCQSALMAPTEILAGQHFKTLSEFLEPLGVKVCLLTGALTQKQKNLLKDEIKNGGYDVIVGTHALVQKSTEFSRLGLVITDEQHRFGVNQRADLAGKGENPHKLVMSATPIPRTLGLIIYGDLDISVLNGFPKGRQPIETYAVTGKLRARAYNFVRERLDEGRQAYIVCPMIEDSDSDLIAVNSYAKKLSEGEFADYSVGLLHGKMSSAEKDGVMEKFRDGEIQLLICTTVVEVGVDVPNAAVMMIENSDRFGLSQLHQLRGRVGRGVHKSYCILVTDHVTPEIKERLKIMSSTNDGFRISEEDMKMRGCGDFFGERQHGLPPLRIASLDSELLSRTQTAAKEIISADSDLSSHEGLKAEVERLFSGNAENSMN